MSKPYCRIAKSYRENECFNQILVQPFRYTLMSESDKNKHICRFFVYLGI